MGPLAIVIFALFVIAVVAVILYFVIDWFWPYTPTPEINSLKEQLSKVDPAFASYDIREHNKESYTKRKARIYICMRDPQSKELYNNNILVYVALHECAHVLTPGTGHDENFNKTFSHLLSKAESVGIYDSSIPFPRSYCGKMY